MKKRATKNLLLELGTADPQLINFVSASTEFAQYLIDSQDLLENPDSHDRRKVQTADRRITTLGETFLETHVALLNQAEGA